MVWWILINEKGELITGEHQFPKDMCSYVQKNEIELVKELDDLYLLENDDSVNLWFFNKNGETVKDVFYDLYKPSVAGRILVRLLQISEVMPIYINQVFKSSASYNILLGNCKIIYTTYSNKLNFTALLSVLPNTFFSNESEFFKTVMKEISFVVKNSMLYIPFNKNRLVFRSNEQDSPKSKIVVKPEEGKNLLLLLFR